MRPGLLDNKANFPGIKELITELIQRILRKDSVMLSIAVGDTECAFDRGDRGGLCLRAAVLARTLFPKAIGVS